MSGSDMSGILILNQESCEQISLVPLLSYQTSHHTHFNFTRDGLFLVLVLCRGCRWWERLPGGVHERQMSIVAELGLSFSGRRDFTPVVRETALFLAQHQCSALIAGCPFWTLR